MKKCVRCNKEYTPSRKLKSGFCSDLCRFESNTKENNNTKKINKTYCLDWIGNSKTERNYGWYHKDNKMHLAHRYSYELYVGIIPVGKIVMHICDRPSCVNPNHLSIGSLKDNMVDKMKKGRSKTAKLSDNDIRNIRNNKKDTNVKLAKIYGISDSRISMIRNKKAYTHVI